MENNIVIPTLEELINKVEVFNKKYPKYSHGKNMTLLKQSIDALNYSIDFVKYLIKNKYDSEYENYYVIYGQIVHYIKYCYDDGNYEEISRMLEFVDEKMKNENEEVNTLAQVGVLELLYIYPDILPKVLELMPKYSKSIFMKYYSDYLKL